MKSPPSPDLLVTFQGTQQGSHPPCEALEVRQGNIAPHGSKQPQQRHKDRYPLLLSEQQLLPIVLTESGSVWL